MTTPIDRLVPLEGNPYLDAFHRWQAGTATDARAELLARYGFAVPDDRAIQLIAAHAPRGVVEIGAGTGYWARQLHDAGVNVVAYDIAPPPSKQNQWFAGQEPCFPVRRGDHHVAAQHTERTLLLVWPTRNEDWAADAAQVHLDAGGERLVYVGEPPGGRTGDLRLHAVLDLVGRCVACAYGVTTVPCTCGVQQRWRLLDQLPLPRWDDGEDRLYVFCRPLPPSRWRWRRRRP